jgi:FkbH-like protein
MFEHLEQDSRCHPAKVAASQERKTPVDIRHRSLLLWGEHCVECAAPSCYRTCDLFEKRPDGHCRRFVHGIVANQRFTGTYGFGAEIKFKKWAKLESQGNVRMLPVETATQLDRWLTLAGRAADFAGRAVTTATGDLRWSRISQAIFARAARRWNKASRLAPEGFLLEVYNPDDKEATLDLTIRLDPYARSHSSPILPPFQTGLRLQPGYSTHFVEAFGFRHITASGRPFLVSLIPAAETTPTLVFLTADFVIAPGAARQVKPAKCVVFDLDGTLWDGVLVESSPVRLRPGIAELLEALDRRGILLSIASKNDHAMAWEKLEEFGVAKYFLRPRISWNPKSESIRDIAQALHLGLDSFVFIDDNPFERDEVRTAAPEVTCLDASDTPSLLHDPRFQGSSTEESKNRRRYYQAALAREQAQTAMAGDYTSFLASCGIQLEVDEYQPEDFERIAELLQRTNQLNFSGRRYTREDVHRLIGDPLPSKLVLRCHDNYGSYGIVGFSIVRSTAGEVTVEDFMLSCRVQAKHIEHAFFSRLRLQNGKPVQLAVHYRDSSRNRPAANVLSSIGFQANATGGMSLDAQASLDCDFIQVSWLEAAELAGQPVQN